MMRIAFCRMTAATAIAVLVTCLTPAFAANTVGEAEMRAFVHRNIDAIPDGQLYLGRPNIVPLGEWADVRQIEADVDDLATAEFAEGPPGPDVLLIERNAEHPGSAFDEFSNILDASGIPRTESDRLWSTALSFPPCAPMYVAPYLVVLSVNNSEDAGECVHKAINPLRGLKVTFSAYSGRRMSPATWAADQQLAGALAQCAPLGWMDSDVRACVFARFEPEAARPAAARRPR